MIEPSNIELLEKYFNYELSDAEDELFKNKLANDEMFKEEYEIALVLRAKALEKRKVAYQLNSAVESTSKTKTIFLKKYLPLLTAAALLIFIGISLYNVNQNSVASIVSIYESTRDAEVIDEYRSSDSKMQFLEQATKAYNQKKFNEAVSKFELHNRQVGLTDEQHYYYGLSLWYIKQYEQALEQFSISNYGRDADWYSALCYIKLQKHIEAKYILEALKNSGYFSDKEKGKHLKILMKKL